ncbi:MAG: porin family protein [Ginsengibacter sp.]
MKKTIIFAFSLFLLHSAQAQQTHFGIKGGLNASSLHFEDNSSYDSKIGFHAGVLAHIHASHNWAIQPEVIYSLEGAKRTVSGTDIKVDLNYVNVPVLFQYMVNDGLRLEAGPQLGFLVNSKTKTGNVSVTNKNFQTVAVSIPVGAGYLTTSGLGFDARYVFGLTSINEKDNPKVQSNVFQFGIFYQFSDTKKR